MSARRPRSLLLVTLAALASSLLTATGASADALQSDTVRIPVVGSVRAVVVGNDIGSVRVAPGSLSNIRADLRYNYDRPSVTHSLRDGVLTVNGDCPDGPALGSIQIGGGFNDCSVDLTITVPRDVTVRARVGLGDIVTRRLRGSEDLYTDLGGVLVDRVSGRSIKAVTGLGDVTLSGIRAAIVTAVSSNGGVAAALAAPARRLTGRSDTGDVDLRVPAGRYALTAVTDLGEVVVRGVVRDRDAARRITAVTDLGDVHVTGFAA